MRAHARWTDPVTSHLAAASIPEQSLRLNQQAVLHLLRRLGPSTDEDIALAYDGPRQSPSGLRTRRHELVAAGFVADSGQRRPLMSGRLSIVWEAVLEEELTGQTAAAHGASVTRPEGPSPVTGGPPEAGLGENLSPRQDQPLKQLSVWEAA